MDGAGNLYGTALYGGNGNSTDCGAYGCGTVFEIGAAGTERMQHSFCVEENCPDGNDPWASLIMDSAGNLYGTTGGGGSACRPMGCGTVFKLTPPDGTEIVIYSFCSKSNCADGRGPNGDIVQMEILSRIAKERFMVRHTTGAGIVLIGPGFGWFICRWIDRLRFFNGGNTELQLLGSDDQRHRQQEPGCGQCGPRSRHQGTDVETTRSGSADRLQPEDLGREPRHQWRPALSPRQPASGLREA